MSLFEMTGLSHEYGDKALYRNASLSLFKGEHMGVVGQNGAGKSTLLKIITGEVVPDEGLIKWQPGVKVGVLNQYAEINGGDTVLEYLRTAFAELYQLERRMEALYQAAAEGDESALFKASGCQEVLERKGFYEIEHEIQRLSVGLGITAFGEDTPMRELSGGQRAKVILAKLLLEQADLLLLDEPTNFLDQEHVSWLAGYLTSFPGAFLVVSHDFHFLEKIATCVCDIEFEEIRVYRGSYSAFLKQKGQLREDYIRQYNAQQKKIQETEAYIRKNKAGNNSKMARGRQKQLDRLERIAPPGFAFQPVIRLQALPLSQDTALRVSELEVGYDAPLLPSQGFVVAGGQKVVITGFNGIGKSTLLKTLMGRLPPWSGQFRFAEPVRLGYYEQDLRWEDHRLTPIQIIHTAYPRLTEKQIRRQLAQVGIDAENALQAVGTLSGGEQSKVKLCRLLLSPCNFLILDEPTNHLDAPTKEALQRALYDFPGSVLLVSHEEAFYRDWADMVVRISGQARRIIS